MNTYNTAELNLLKISDITHLYNDFASICKEKPVKKFRDKPTAVKRTLEIQDAALKAEWENKMVAEHIKAKAEDVTRSSRTKRASDKKLTPKEHAVFNAIVINGLDAMGGIEPIDLIEDNMSWFDNADLIKSTGLSKHQCAGLIASLEEKGLVVNSEEGINGKGAVQWSLTDEGIRYAENIKDEPVPEIVVKPAGKGNAKTDMTAKVEIVKVRNNKEGSIGDCIFNAVNALDNPTVQDLADHIVATYSKPRSNVPVDPGFVVSTIRFFVKEGTLKFS